MSFLHIPTQHLLFYSTFIHCTIYLYTPSRLYCIFFNTFQNHVCNFLHALPPLHIILINFYKYHHYSYYFLHCPPLHLYFINFYTHTTTTLTIIFTWTTTTPIILYTFHHNICLSIFPHTTTNILHILVTPNYTYSHRFMLQLTCTF